MPIRIKDLLKQIPSETGQVVDRTRTRFNTAIRQMLRQETGLRLITGRGSEDEKQETHAIRILIEAGVPAEMEYMEFSDDKWLAILLAPWRTDLQSLQRSAHSTKTGLIERLPAEIVCEGPYAGIATKLKDVASFAEHLLQISTSIDLVKELHAIDNDILGQYRFGSTKQNQDSASIHLYWGVIGLVARALGVSVEGLTIKVLAHELAHAYTHLGADIDGHRWETNDFGNAERAVKEGLAQFYTRQLLARLNVRMPEAEIAYKTLLPHQPQDYQVQERWVAEGATAEHVRLAMVLFRRSRQSSLARFEEFLEQAKRDLGRRWRHQPTSLFDEEYE
jgi:hypothetical protein